MNPCSLLQNFVSSVCEYVPLLGFPFFDDFVAFSVLSKRVSINAIIVYTTACLHQKHVVYLSVRTQNIESCTCVYRQVLVIMKDIFVYFKNEIVKSILISLYSKRTLTPSASSYFSCQYHGMVRTQNQPFNNTTLAWVQLPLHQVTLCHMLIHLDTGIMKPTMLI